MDKRIIIGKTGSGKTFKLAKTMIRNREGRVVYISKNDNTDNMSLEAENFVSMSCENMMYVASSINVHLFVDKECASTNNCTVQKEVLDYIYQYTMEENLTIIVDDADVVLGSRLEELVKKNTVNSNIIILTRIPENIKKASVDIKTLISNDWEVYELENDALISLEMGDYYGME